MCGFGRHFVTFRGYCKTISIMKYVVVIFPPMRLNVKYIMVVYRSLKKKLSFALTSLALGGCWL